VLGSQGLIHAGDHIQEMRKMKIKIHTMTEKQFQDWEAGLEPELPWVCKMEEKKCTAEDPCDGCWGFRR